MNLWYLLLVVPGLLAWLAQARVRKVYGSTVLRRTAAGSPDRRRRKSSSPITD